MKGDDSCCQSGSNKNFKGSHCECSSETESHGCGCMEEVEMPTAKKVKGKAAKAMMKEESHCCGSCGGH